MAISDLFKGNITSFFKKEEEKKEEPKYFERPLKKQIVKVENIQGGVEAYYFWILNFLRNPNALDYEVDKTSDVYTATETSTYFGNVEQRKAIQQDRVSQFLATIGKLIKDLFQIVRELRVIDERLTYYSESKKSGEEGESAEIALKGTWIDVVEGGSKNPASVYGLATQVGFTTLPDLFFKVNVKKKEDISKVMESMEKEGFNRKIREVLERKLFQYYVWKEKTEFELSSRKNFMLKYLRQHYHSIQLYMRWIKPYLKNVKKLQMGAITGPDLVTAFETSQIELELVAIKKKYLVETKMGYVIKDFKKIYPCLRIKFNYVTIPQMVYQTEGQRGAVHTGRTTITVEGYTITKEGLEAYKKKKDDEDVELLESLNEAMKSMDEEIKKYLKEAGEKFKEDIQKEEDKEQEKLLAGIGGMFGGVFTGLKETLGSLVPRSEREEVEVDEEEEKYVAENMAKVHAFILYEAFKKSNGMLTY